MKKLLFLLAMLFLSSAIFAGCTTKTGNSNENNKDDEATVLNGTDSEQRIKTAPKIQVAILLDTSGSMQGLIEQTKSRLWNIINTLTTLKYGGQDPIIEIALYEYGNYSIKNSDYIRQVTQLTTDLDLISEKLFALTAGGSEEYCGAVISDAINVLDWGSNSADMKLIYIAGNEEFNQGKVSYKEAIRDAIDKNIFINTIHCGNAETGIRDLWRDAAERGQGKFFNIDANTLVQHISTPYDDRISTYNQKLNDTYISYGASGSARKRNQTEQDYNAKELSSGVYTERAISKSKAVYNNSSWDLVDLVKENKDALEEISNNDLPAELQNKSSAELEKIIREKERERSTIQNEIAELAKQRQEYIDSRINDNNSADDLGKAINSSIIEFAKQKGFSIEKG